MSHEVSVLLFARLRELAGAPLIRVTLPQGATVSELRRAIAEQWSALADLASRSALAINGDYADEDRAIEASDEIALIPPVSGEAMRSGTRQSSDAALRRKSGDFRYEIPKSDIASMAIVTRDPIDHDMLTEMVRRPHCGAVVTFLGTVRDLTGEEVTDALEYEAHEPMALRKMDEIEDDVRDRWAGAEIALVHRLGRLEIGEVSVAVAVSTPHRAEAFAACRHAIDRLKEIVPIWKKDFGPDGTSEWIHPEGTKAR